MKNFIRFAIERFRTIITLLVLILGAGTYILITIPRESFPDMDIPYAVVTVTYQGVSPQDSQKLLLEPMEGAIKSIDGVKEFLGYARDGVAQVAIEFDMGVDIDDALLDLKDEIDSIKKDLPPSADDPIVREITLNEEAPAILVSLAGDVPEVTLQAYTKKLQDAIKAVIGVLDADIQGYREEQIEIIINPSVLENYNISLDLAQALISSVNAVTTAGRQETEKGSFPLRAPGRFDDITEIIDTTILVDGNARVTIGDIAEIRRSFKEPSSLGKIDGKPALVLGVSKRSGMNETTVIDSVKAAVDKEVASWDPLLLEKLEIQYSQDSSVWVKRILDDLGNTVILSILLVMIAVLLALGLRAATLVVISVPSSFLLGIILINGQGLTLNMMVLFGLILSVGLLVDGSIIVVEYADRRMREGLNRKDAYASASSRMFLPVLSSTATTLSAFIPLLFWPGIEGEFMRFLPLTLIAILSASLVVALIFVPVLGSLFGAPAAKSKNDTSSLFSRNSSLEEMLSAKGFTGIYVRLLNRILDFSGVFIFIITCMLFVSILAFNFYGKGSELFPSGDPDLATVTVKSQGNYSLQEMQAIMDDVEERIPHKDEYKSIFVKTNRDSNGGSTIGVISLELEDYQKRRPATALLQSIQDTFDGYVGAEIIVAESESGPPVGKAVQLDIFAPTEAERVQALNVAKDWLSKQPEVIDIEDNRPLAFLEYQTEIDREQISRFGASMGSINRALSLTTDGAVIGTWQPDDSDEELDIRMRYAPEFRTLEQVDNTNISTSLGHVPLSNFASVKFASGDSVILHKNGEGFFQLGADLKDKKDAPIIAIKLKEYLASPEAGISPNVRLDWGGEGDKQTEVGIFLVEALIVAIFMIAIILLTQFNSFYATFLILTAIVFSLTGVFASMLIMGLRFSIMMTGVGVIALAGIVINNNIVLIDTFQLQRNFHPDEDVRISILRTGGQRLRPVLLTTVTTVLGLIPMVLKISINFVSGTVAYNSPTSQIWVQLSAAIAGGLIYSTVLTLAATPCLLYMGRVFTKDVKKRTLSRFVIGLAAIILLWLILAVIM